jgi:hypothetical protein
MAEHDPRTPSNERRFTGRTEGRKIEWDFQSSLPVFRPSSENLLWICLTENRARSFSGTNLFSIAMLDALRDCTSRRECWPMALVKSQMRHAAIATTERYAHLGKTPRKEAAKAIRVTAVTVGDA